MESLELLKKLGLTEYESKVYISLAKLGPSKVKDIVMNSNVPRNKVYEALNSLEQKNKVMSIPLSPKEYKISEPTFLKDDLEDMQSSMKEFLEQLAKPKSSELKELFWVIKGQKSIQEKISVQVENTKKEILGSNHLSKILYKNIRELKQAVNRGVKVKFICTFDKTRINIYNEWLSTGAKIRVFNHKKFGPLLPRISIFDGKIARLTIGKPEVQNEEDYITLWTESRVFSQMLRNHFLNMWKNSEPLEKYLKAHKI
jgi:sugar-specific transcriptional regulator TrmB